MTIRSRMHFLLEPPSSAGGPEKLFRFYEEIGGNKLLNERWDFKINSFIQAERAKRARLGYKQSAISHMHNA